jgi:hypothetical protein
MTKCIVFNQGLKYACYKDVCTICGKHCCITSLVRNTKERTKRICKYCIGVPVVDSLLYVMNQTEEIRCFYGDGDGDDDYGDYGGGGGGGGGGGDYDDILYQKKTLEKNQNYWYECCCGVRYTEYIKKNPDYIPKCNSCTTKTNILNYIECNVCNNKIQTYYKTRKILRKELKRLKNTKHKKQCEILKEHICANKFICPLCLFDSKDTTYEKLVEIDEIIMLNNLFDICKETINYKLELIYSNGRINNNEEVIRKVLQYIENGNLDSFTSCCICENNYFVKNMNDACLLCHNKICNSCITYYYSQIKIGHIVMPNYCHCPVCNYLVKNNEDKRLEKYSIFKINNFGIEFDPFLIYSLCTDCICIKPFCAKDCIKNKKDLLNLQLFKCSDCIGPESKSYKKCPHCSVLTERYGGCNHMTCEMCNNHWCWICKKGFDTKHHTEQHCIDVHGGLFADCIMSSDSDDSDSDSDSDN